MKYNSGGFKCPKCGKNKMGDYFGWKNVKKYQDNQDNPNNQILTTYWIFYTKEVKKCIFTIIKECYFCCSKKETCCDVTGGCNWGNFICNIFALIWGLIITPIWIAYYLLFLVWFDIYGYNCDEEKTSYYYYGIFGNKKKDKKDKEDNKGYLNKEIWEYYDGYEEDYINKNVEKKCNNCNRKEDSFLNFIPGYKINIKNDDKPISLIFSTQDNIIQTSLVCYPNDKFSDVVNKIYEKEVYPEYKNKPKYYLSNGERIEENKTIEQNKFKDGNKVFIVFIEEESDNSKIKPLL